MVFIGYSPQRKILKFDQHQLRAPAAFEHYVCTHLVIVTGNDCYTEDGLLMAGVTGDSGSGMEERIRPIWADLVRRLLYVEDITEQLELNCILTRQETEIILHQQKTRLEWNRGLLRIIQQRRGAYDIFSQCLRVSGQDELYQLMVSTGPVQPVTDELTTLAYRVYCKHGIGDPRHLNVPPHIQQRLRDQCDALQEMKNEERLLELMVDEGCFVKEVTEAIKKQPSDIQKVRILVDNVMQSTLYSFFALVKFLDISQQKHLLAQIYEDDTKKALDHMKGLLLEVYFNLLGGIALKDSELEERLGVRARDFVTLSINSDSKAVERQGAKEVDVEPTEKGDIELVDLFRDPEIGQTTRTVLLIGAPGAGKTTAVMQLAREATAKKASNIPRPPFIIKLSSIDWTTETSLKNLLLCWGPTLTSSELEQVWSALLEHDTDVTVILDGADEATPGFLDLNASPVSGTEQKASPKHILNNLILGKLLKGARVLVSSRRFGLEQCWSKFNRKVEVAGFNDINLERFLKNELSSTHLHMVQKFLKKRIDIRHLLLIPLHAASFVLRAQNIDEEDDLLLQSRTELSLSLIDSLVKTKCRKENNGTVEKMTLGRKGSTLLKVCKCVSGILIRQRAIKVEMTEEEIVKAGISRDECLATGLFSEKIVVADEVSKRIFILPHQSIVESLAALGLEESQIMKLVNENDGRHDQVLTYVVGVFGSQSNRKMLEYILNKEDWKMDMKELTMVIVQKVLGSKRRLLEGGEEFCHRIVVESQQWEVIGDLVRVMKTRWVWSNSSEALMVANQLIRHDLRRNTSDPLIKIKVDGIDNVKYCPQATALLQFGEVTAADIARNAEHLHNISSFSFSARAGITRETVAGITRELSRLHNLEAVAMGVNRVWSASSDESSVLNCLSSIPSLQYLRFSACDLMSADVVAVTSSCPHLLHLDISKNCGIRGRDVKSKELAGLSVMKCKLRRDDVVEMATSNGQSLEFLNVIDFGNVLSSSHISSLLTHCPHLREMYVYGGGELVRALSERRVAHPLNHLWLRKCDLSSSSSWHRNVNSSMLRDVLTNHPDITSLTLYKCGPFRAWHPFTPRVIRHLSSSMASITSLFISPRADYRPPRSSDVAYLIRASPNLTQFWLDDASQEWRAPDYITVIRAVNASPALRVVGLDVSRLSVDEVRVLVRKLRRPLTRLWLLVKYWMKREEYAEVVMEGKLGVVQLIPDYGYDLYPTYVRESGLCYQHLPLSLPDNFRPTICLG